MIQVENDNEILNQMLKLAQTKYLGLLKNMAAIELDKQNIFSDIFICGTRENWRDCVTIECLTNQSPMIIFWYDDKVGSTHLVKILWNELVDAGNEIKKEHEAGK